jgi:proteasome lid subunit RPN8/RPN11
MILVSAAQLAEIAQLAEAAFPSECCGLLVGVGQRTIRVTELVPAPNLLADRHDDRFELDPKVRIATELRLRGTHRRIVGHWHSHPDGSALPSATDLAQAFEPDLIWLIAGVTALDGFGPQTVQILAHRLDGERGRIWPVRLGLAEKNACKPRGFRG